MLDIQFIRDNAALVAEKALQKGYPVDVQKLLQLDEERRSLVQQVEALRARRNDIASSMKGGKPEQALVDEGKQLKIELAEREKYLQETEDEWLQLLKQVPNMPLDDVPVGATEEENVVVKEWGEHPQFDFEPKNHWEIADARGLIDKDRAAKVAGARFAYIKGPLVELQFALMQWVTQTLGNEDIIAQIIKDNGLNLSSKPFMPVLPPAVVRTEPYEASGRLNAAEQTYKLEGDDQWLNASAEHSLCTMYMNEVLDEAELPIRYLGYATSFRREAGTYGKDMEGIIRMHQFDKLEMEVFSSGETGLEEHKLQVAIQEHLMQALKIPYRLLNKCTFDIGKPNARGVDLDAWLPGQGKYRETHTADYMTDYQARSLRTRVKSKDGSVKFVHTNDATAFALGRILVAIIENYQTADGSIRVPEVLQPLLANRAII